LRDPSRPALNIGGRDVSYQVLAGASSAISAFLREKLGGGQKTVGVLCEKSFSAYAGMLGAMESGNIYVPLNPKFPINRLEQIACIAGIAALVVDPSSVSKAAQLLELLGPGVVVYLPGNADVPAELRKYPAFPHAPADSAGSGVGDEPSQNGAEYAYLLFTSGTTGTPKGVPVTHQNASSCIEAVCERFEFHNTDRFTQFSELSFDVSIGDIFLCWKAGACLYVPLFAELMSPAQFANRHQLTVWSSVPTLANNLRALGALKPGSLSSLRLSMFCGEALPAVLAKDWQAAAPSGLVINFYGPTEAAIFSTFHVWDKSNPPSGAIVPLGVPLSGFQYRISNEDDATQKADTGELLLSGPQVVNGYWNNPAATEKAFVRLPDDKTGRVWYRTGDRVSLNGRNELAFHGRCDRQVKIRGYRVELDEVESVLRRVTDADLVAVVPVYARDGRCEDLLAFCGTDIGDEEDVKQRCRAHLPAYMLPRRIIHLEEFPRSTNGKVDYRLLGGMANGSRLPEPRQEAHQNE
jgi:D-alanine--poly(phosphoribitol) ligase subunit 1